MAGSLGFLNRNLRNSKPYFTHLEMSHIGIQFTIVMALILGQLLDFLSLAFMDNPCVIPQTRDEPNTQFVKETQILFGGIPVVKCEI
jgi:hypothetical protein